MSDGETAPRVLVESSPDLPLVSITVARPRGASDDPTGRDGLTRLAARLCRRTGGGMSPQAIDVRIDSMGASLGVEVGSSTASFHGTTLARSLSSFVELLVDVIGRPSLADEELARLKRETEAEIVDARDDDSTLARRWFRRKLFAGHAYGRPIGGTLASIGAIGPDDVRSAYGRLSSRDDAIFAFAGDVTERQALEAAGTIHAALAGAATATDSVPEPTSEPGRRLVIVDKPDRTQTQILIGGLGTHPRDDDHVALHVANTVFGGTFTARLTQEVRSKRGWSYGAYSSLPYDRNRRAFSLWTFPKAEDAAPCIRLELDLLRQWWTDGVTSDELEWVKSYLIRSHAFTVDTAAKRVGLRLDAELFDLPPGYHDHYVERVRAVTLEQVNAAVRNRISLDDLLITVVGTERDIGADVRAAIDDLQDNEIVPFDSD